MQNILKAIKKAKKIALFSHSNPDPDTIGSTLAMYEILKQKQKQVSLFCDMENMSNYAFLRYFDKYNTDELEGFDLYISVDIPTNTMFGKFEEPFVNFDNTIKIDHHASGADFAKKAIVKTYSACAVLVFEIAKKLKAEITSDMATALYFGICGDTGLFRNTNTDSLSFKVCSELFAKGADFRRIYTEFFDKKNVPSVKLTANAILGAEIDEENKFVVMSVSADDYERFGALQTENIGNLPHTYLNCGYKIATILKERDDGIHCSFRSKFEYDCSIVAGKFGGGGHKNASGCKIDTSMDKAKEMVKQEIINYLKVVE